MAVLLVIGRGSGVSGATIGLGSDPRETAYSSTKSCSNAGTQKSSIPMIITAKRRWCDHPRGVQFMHDDLQRRCGAVTGWSSLVRRQRERQLRYRDARTAISRLVDAALLPNQHRALNFTHFTDQSSRSSCFGLLCLSETPATGGSMLQGAREGLCRVPRTIYVA